MNSPQDVKVERTPLPGVGLRLEFVAAGGRRVGVVHRQHGQIDLFVSHPDDSDLTALTVELTAAEAHTLTELLGGSSFSQELSHLQEAAEGIVVDWLPIEPGTPFVGRPLGDTQLRTKTGVSVVAVIREGAPIPSPIPMFMFAEGDVLVTVGTIEGLTAAASILASGP
jgi:TrkA domain protein